MPLSPILLAGASAALISAAAPTMKGPAMNGQALFAENCSACHQVTGKGVPGAFPALAGDTFVQGPPQPVAATVLNGRGGMPTFRNDLSDAQIATVITYVRSAWGNHAPAVDAATVARVRGVDKSENAGASLQAH
ncbi:MAG: cytochrome c [Caulobacteraceae bacterium]